MARIRLEHEATVEFGIQADDMARIIADQLDEQELKIFLRALSDAVYSIGFDHAAREIFAEQCDKWG